MMQADIKIFVSRRLGVDSTVIPNPLYVPVVCGAAHEVKKRRPGILGDNTGENISLYNKNFCEFTVQYWAWKNVKADYYGLCHYRRYLTFTSRTFKKNSEMHIMEGLLDKKTFTKYELANTPKIRAIIEQNDVVVNEPADVSQIYTPKGYKDSVYAHWEAYDRIYLDKRVLPLLMETIKRQFPQYYPACQAYMGDHWHRGFNCYVMKKELFDAMCTFQFTVLFAIEKQLKENGLADHFERTLGYLGEIMYGMFIYYLEQQGKYKIQEEQLVYFEQTVVPDSSFQKTLDKILFFLKFRFNDSSFFLLPRGSRRRKLLKHIYMTLTKKT